MQIETHKQYDKMWAKLNKKQQERVLLALKLFMKTPAEPRLRLHQLQGRYYPQYSMSAGGDLRIHFTRVGAARIVLMMVGGSSQLYQ